MSFQFFRSKPLAYFAMCVFLLFMMNTSLSLQAEASGQDAKTELQAGTALFSKGEFVSAINRLSKIPDITEDKTILSDAYFYMSLSYFHIWDYSASENYLKKSLALNPDRTTSEMDPEKFQTLFNKCKNELGTGYEQKTDPPVQTDDPDILDRGYPAAATSEPQEEKKSSKILFIVGGVVLAAAAGILVYMMTRPKTGSLQVNSTPSGAAVSLDGTSTGQTTNCTLADLDPGAHSVKLVLDGYLDFNQSVTVEKGKTATLSATLTPHTISISNPNSNSIWIKGTNVTITWQVSPGAAALNRTGVITGNSTGFMSPAMRRNAFRSSFINREASGKPVGRRIQNSGSPFALKGKSSGERQDGARSAGADSRTNTLRLRGGKVERITSPFPVLPRPGINNGVNRGVLAVASVNLDLLRGGNVVQSIAANTPNDGTQTWTVPIGLASATNYQVKVSCSTAANVSGTSANFRIADVGKIRATSVPTGANVFLDGSDTNKNTNVTLNNIYTGAHTVKFTKDRFQNYQKNINVNKNQTTNVHKVLDPGTFLENFNKNTAIYWERIWGTADWVAENQMFKMKNGSGYAQQACDYSPGHGTFPNNWTYQAKMKITKGSEWHALGLLFGGDPSDGSYYLLDVLAGGHRKWSLWKITKTKDTNIKGWKSSSAINKTDWNTLKIVANGKTFTFYINGVQIYQRTILGAPTKGGIGLWTWRYGSNNETSYDDIGLTLSSAPIKPIAPGKLGVDDFSEGQTGLHPAFPPGTKKK